MNSAILPLVVVSSALLLAADRATLPNQGIEPKPSRAEYDATGFTESLAVGATLVAPQRVRTLFGPQVDRQYVVVEVGFYSKDRSSFPVRLGDFALKAPKGLERIAPEPPERVASSTGGNPTAIVAKTLPQVSTSRAVAGYLFFPTGRVPGTNLELDYQGNGSWLTMPLR